MANTTKLIKFTMPPAVNYWHHEIFMDLFCYVFDKLLNIDHELRKVNGVV